MAPSCAAAWRRRRSASAVNLPASKFRKARHPLRVRGGAHIFSFPSPKIPAEWLSVFQPHVRSPTILGAARKRPVRNPRFEPRGKRGGNGGKVCNFSHVPEKVGDDECVLSFLPWVLRDRYLVLTLLCLDVFSSCAHCEGIHEGVTATRLAVVASGSRNDFVMRRTFTQV